MYNLFMQLLLISIQCKIRNIPLWIQFRSIHKMAHWTPKFPKWIHSNCNMQVLRIRPGSWTLQNPSPLHILHKCASKRNLNNNKRRNRLIIVYELLMGTGQTRMRAFFNGSMQITRSIVWSHLSASLSHICWWFWRRATFLGRVTRIFDAGIGVRHLFKGSYNHFIQCYMIVTGILMSFLCNPFGMMKINMSSYDPVWLKVGQLVLFSFSTEIQFNDYKPVTYF